MEKNYVDKLQNNYYDKAYRNCLYVTMYKLVYIVNYQ